MPVLPPILTFFRAVFGEIARARKSGDLVLGTLFQSPRHRDSMNLRSP